LFGVVFAFKAFVGLLWWGCLDGPKPAQKLIKTSENPLGEIRKVSPVISGKPPMGSENPHGRSFGLSFEGGGYVIFKRPL